MGQAVLMHGRIGETDRMRPRWPVSLCSKLAACKTIRGVALLLKLCGSLYDISKLNSCSKFLLLKRNCCTRSSNLRGHGGLNLLFYFLYAQAISNGVTHLSVRKCPRVSVCVSRNGRNRPCVRLRRMWLQRHDAFFARIIYL
jgi:hypothetical protein